MNDMQPPMPRPAPTAAHDDVEVGAPVERSWWQKALILLAGAAVLLSLVGSTIFVVMSLWGSFAQPAG